MREAKIQLPGKEVNIELQKELADKLNPIAMTISALWDKSKKKFQMSLEVSSV